MKYVKSCGRYGRTLTTTYREGEKKKEEAKHQSISNYLHGLDAGGTPSGTWRQRNGSIDSGSHRFFYLDGQKYGNGSSQILALLLQEDRAPF